MRRLFLSLLVFAFTLPALAQAKHPFTFEDMMKLKRVGEPEVSPDGKWVIFSVVDVDLEANTKTPHIWIVPLAGMTQGSSTPQNASPSANHAAPVGMTEESGVPHVSPNLRDVGSGERILIADQDADRPRWAPDGKRFAFLSTKEGGSQVWIADFDDTAGTVTAVHKLTSVATEAGGELWSPDGKNILFTSDVYPECDGAPVQEERCNAIKLNEVKTSKVTAQVFTHLLYRHWNGYKEGKRSHIFVTSLDSSAPIETVAMCKKGDPSVCPSGRYRDLTPGDYDSPEFSLGGQDDYAFSPDGQEICYTSNHDKVEATSTNNDLWIVPVNVGADAFVRPAASGASGVEGSAQAQDWVKTVLAHTKNITADNPASDSTPLYSPDGRYIAYRAQQRPGYESDQFRLMRYDRRTAEKMSLTETFQLSPGIFGQVPDPWVGTFVWMPNSRSILFVVEEGGQASIWQADAEAPEATPESAVTLPHATGPHTLGMPTMIGGIITGTKSTLFPIAPGAGGYDDDLLVTPNGEWVIFTRMSIYAPTEIYTRNIAEEKWPPTAHQVTHVNDKVLSHIAMSELNFFSFPGAHNDKVEGFLVKPPNFDAAKKYPVKFLIHGGPQQAWGDDWSYRWNPELFAAPTSSGPGYVVVMINFHGSTGYGQKFIDSINGDWGGGPFEDLMKGLDYAEEHYGFIDKTRECALGASFGGYMVNWIAGHTDRFKCLVSHDGGFNNESDWATTDELWFNNWEFHGTPYTNRELYLKWSPHMYAKNFKTPTLVIHGQLDYRLDVSEGFQMFDTLQMMGVPSKMLYFPDEGHWVLKPQNSRLWYKTVNDWVDQWTK